jgi:hypothetical protein
VILEAKALRGADLQSRAHALAKEHKLALVEDEALLAEKRRPHGMAAGADGHVRRGVPGRCRPNA